MILCTENNNGFIKYKEGFYVYAPPSKYKSYVDLIKYICMYVSNHVISESRIIDCDGTFITILYQRIMMI